MKIKLNVDLGKFQKGSIINIKVDDNDIPIEQYWRARLKDSAKDNCIELVQDDIKIKSKKKRAD